MKPQDTARLVDLDETPDLDAWRYSILGYRSGLERAASSARTMLTALLQAHLASVRPGETWRDLWQQTLDTAHIAEPALPTEGLLPVISADPVP